MCHQIVLYITRAKLIVRQTRWGPADPLNVSLKASNLILLQIKQSPKTSLIYPALLLYVLLVFEMSYKD